MKVLWTLSGIEEGKDGVLLFRGGEGAPSRQVLTVAQASRILKRSRRQVYRYLKDGALLAVGKVMNEWLVDKENLDRFRQAFPQVQRLPGRFQKFFPEYNVKELNPGTDRIVVMSRLLEVGGLDEIGWLFRRFEPGELKSFLKTDGARLLSKKCLNFWSLVFEMKAASSPFWRKQGWEHGGSV